jgi:transglutaminase-like putative cysteine protease
VKHERPRLDEPRGRAWRSPADADPARFLAADPVIQTGHPDVQRLARALRSGRDDEQFAARAYRWVRDEVAHSFDARDPRVTLTASQVLEHRVGLCYAKSHLAAALLRAGGVPTGLCYQRLSDGEGGFVLHGLIAVHLRGAWHRQDPRGNREGIDASYSLGGERPAYVVDRARGEVDYPGVHAGPAPAVVRVLTDATDVLTCALPASLGDGA